MARVIKRTWTTAKGEQKEAWIVRYWQKDKDGIGRQHISTHKTKKEAEAERNKIGLDIGQGTHVAPSQSITVEQAARLWLQACETNQLERATLSRYRVYVDKHIVPLVGPKKLSDLNNLPNVCWFQDELRRKGRSLDLTRKVMTALSSIVQDAHER